MNVDDDNDIFYTPLNGSQDLLTSEQQKQNVKNYSIAFKDTLELPQIREIYKLSENTTLKDKEIDHTIQRVLASSKQVKLSALDSQILIDKLSQSMSLFDNTSWKQNKVLGEGTYGKVCLLKKGSEKIAYKTFKMGVQPDLIRELGSYALLSATNTQYSPKIFGMTFEPDISIALELARGSLWDYAMALNFQQRIDVFPVVYDMAIKCLSEFQSCNLVNCDIKSRNMLAWWSGSKGIAGALNLPLCKLRLTDFGLTSSRPDWGDHVYTPGFRAPELYGTQLQANKETDVYAMGKTLIEFLFKDTFLDENYKQHEVPDNFVEILKNKVEHGNDVLAMVSSNPENRPRMPITIFTFPKRQWGKIEDDIFDGIAQDAWKRCKTDNKLSNATFIQTIDLTLRCTYIDKERFTNLNYETSACLLLASYWGEFTVPVFPRHMNKLRSDMKAILEMINGLVYLPGLEYMENMTYDEMVAEFTKKMIPLKN